MPKKLTIHKVLNVRRIKGGCAVRVELTTGAVREERISRSGDALQRYQGAITGYGAAGARTIREAAESYFETFDALTPEQRAKQLLKEADEHCFWCYERLRHAISETGRRLDADKESGNPDVDIEPVERAVRREQQAYEAQTAMVERAVRREQQAYEAQTAMHDFLCLLFGDDLRLRWTREEEFEEALAEAKRLQAEQGDS